MRWKQLGRQWDGKQSGREQGTLRRDGKQSGRNQDTLRRDGRRWEQTTTTGTVGKSRSGTKHHTVSRSRPGHIFPSRLLPRVALTSSGFQRVSTNLGEFFQSRIGNTIFATANDLFLVRMATTVTRKSIIDYEQSRNRHPCF